VDIIPVPPMVLTADSTLGCKPFAAHFSMEDTMGGAWADWNFFDGPVLTGRPMAMSFVYDQFGTYDLGVTVHWPNGCITDTLYNDLVTVIDMPHADFNWTPDPADIFGPTVQFHELAGPTATSFLWNFAGTDTSTAANPFHTFPDDHGALYPVQLWATNELGCTDSILRIVNVDDVFLVHVPTAFSPDGDGLNEILNVIGNDISNVDFHFMIFDRWGEKVFDSTDRDKGWDGKYNGKPVPNGVYVWMLRAQSIYTGVNHDLRGHVTVVR
jgi:gliding motility-associated-like protein